MAKTVKVRIPVAIDPKGRYYAHQWSTDASGLGVETMGHLLELTDYDTIGPGEVIHWLTAELPVPEPVEVQAEVETAS